MKKCTGCFTQKPLEEFHNYKTGKFGKKAKCKKCIIKISAKYQKENALTIKERRRNHYLTNKDKILTRVNIYNSNNSEKIKKYQKNYRVKNRSELNKYYTDRNKVDFIFYLKGRIRKAINQSIKNNGFTKLLSTENILGCDFNFFKEYIENQFVSGMNWSNIHIDHIKPMRTANTEKRVLELNHYTNLQPLFAIDNLKKGGKIIAKQLKLI